MNGVHDMGGLQGFGPVQPEADEPLFHAAWERRALGLTLAMGATGAWNIDQSRAARESLPPAQYLGSSYYAIWLAALERLMLQRGLLDNAEVAAVHRGRLATAAAPKAPTRWVIWPPGCSLTDAGWTTFRAPHFNCAIGDEANAAD